MKGKLQDLVMELEMAQGIWFEARHRESEDYYSSFKDIYKMIRKDIVKRYELQKGQYTMIYAYTRGRKKF